MQRIELIGGKLPLDTEKALAGGVAAPTVTVSQAFDIYCNEIVADELLGKSENQRRQWKKVKLRAANNFIAVIGDKPMGEITRKHGQRMYRLWLDRIVPKGAKPTHSASSENRDLGNMRVLYEAHFAHMGEPDIKNPFAGLHFSTKRQGRRPPFSVDWIKTKVMAAGAMKSLNNGARQIVLVMIETGARPSEIANLTDAAIRLSDEVPHIAIEPRDDPDEPRESKTLSSGRRVPLVGVALEVFKRRGGGFERYRNRENELSATLNRFFKRNGLFLSTKHKIYSFRHSMEDRMKEGGLDEELRKIIMGTQSIDPSTVREEGWRGSRVNL